MRPLQTAVLVASALLVACGASRDRQTLADLRAMEPDLAEVRVEDGLEQAMKGYRRYLEEAPESTLTPEAMRRLADLNLEKEYGILGGAPPSAASSLPEPATSRTPAGRDAERVVASETEAMPPAAAESDRAFERRATAMDPIPSSDAPAPALPGTNGKDPSGPLEAIALYDRILETHPRYPQNDQVLYQKARALDELGRNDEAIAVIERLIADHPGSRHLDEVQFRRAEYFFVRRKYLDAEEAYAAIVAMGAASSYYELALYKLGWTLYKQELHEEALDQYVALLDHKVALGHDFDQIEDESDARRLADSFRVISLSFSSLGGPEVVARFFADAGSRPYEARIYEHLGEFYLEKRRYADAANAYETFVGLHPLHASAPNFGMRVVEIYEAGGFPRLVLDAKKSFAAAYGLGADYWQHFDVTTRPEVLRALKANLEDLANHYHALYQEPEQSEDRPGHFEEASRWYSAYLESFPADPETPAIHYRLADLLLEHGAFAEAAQAYQHTAYDYPAHDQASEAGYAAIFAHRQRQEQAEEVEAEAARRAAVDSTLRFLDAFPDHERAAAVMSVAVDDLYAMEAHTRAIAVGRRLIEEYPDAEIGIRRSAWSVVAHASFDVGSYPEAERAYGRVLELAADDDPTRPDVVDNLAAAIYKQGEHARQQGDPAGAAEHFLRLAEAAPTSTIRPVAEYDAAAALIELESWIRAAAVLEALRTAFPEHELHREATKQVAFVYREQGDLGRAAQEYRRVAAEAEKPEVRREALLTAGQLYEDADDLERALATYLETVREFTHPIEQAVETRFRIAEIHDRRGERDRRVEQLHRIVALDAAAGAARTPRVRTLAARSALVLAELHYERFDEVELVQPFDEHLAEKQRRMDLAIDAFASLVDYEVGEVTAAATYYMAEIYAGLSRSLLQSERPGDLSSDERIDYEMVLEEEAWPFEERAIDVHEKNLELMAAGVYNGWIEKSLAELAGLVPGRYAKFEASTGWIGSVDTYVYRAPAAPTAPPTEQRADASAGAPAAAELTDAAAAKAAKAAEPRGEAAEAGEVEATVQADEIVPAAADPASASGAPSEPTYDVESTKSAGDGPPAGG